MGQLPWGPEASSHLHCFCFSGSDIYIYRECPFLILTVPDLIRVIAGCPSSGPFELLCQALIAVDGGADFRFCVSAPARKSFTPETAHGT